MNSNSSKNRAVITGASSGIGKATALAFASAGIDVALIGRSRAKLQAVVEEAQALGVEARAYVVDLAKVESVRTEMEAIASDFAPVNILVNNAGMGYTGTLSETPLADWQQVLDLNLTSIFQSIVGILPSMRDRGKGTIINIASIAGKTPFPGWGAYSVSKAGLIALSKTLAAEERPQGIRVVVFSPGAVNTPIWDTETVSADFDRTAMLTPEIVAQSILHTALLPDGAAIEDITLMPSGGAL